MSRGVVRRVAFVVSISLIIAVAVAGTIVQRRSIAEYSRARSAVRTAIDSYEKVLTTGEPRSRAVAALRTAGADVESARGDIVITVLRELQSSAQCRSLVGQLQVGIDANDRVTGWRSPPYNAECD